MYSKTKNTFLKKLLFSLPQNLVDIIGCNMYLLMIVDCNLYLLYDRRLLPVPAFYRWL